MYFKDYKCEKCENVFGGTKVSIMDEWPKLKCEKCGSTKTHTLFAIGGTDVAQGILGNAANGYTTGITSHPSKFGNFKGTTVKTI